MALEAGELPSKSTDETERHRVRAGVHIGGEGSAVLVTRKTSGEGTRHVGGFFGLGNGILVLIEEPKYYTPGTRVDCSLSLWNIHRLLAVTEVVA